MKASIISVAAIASLATAHSVRHGHSHAHHHKRTAENALLSALGVLEGVNAEASGSSSAWFGTDGDYVAEFKNEADETIDIVIWTESWINVDQPLITHTLTNGSAVSISFASGASGAFAAVYENTTMLNGQISNTWGEFTVDGEYSTIDVSRLPNMDGRELSLVATECTSNMTTCVFTCDSGTTCEFEYTLENCETGSQKGAECGTYDGTDSGGCLVGDDNKFTAVFS